MLLLLFTPWKVSWCCLQVCMLMCRESRYNLSTSLSVQESAIWSFMFASLWKLLSVGKGKNGVCCQAKKVNPSLLLSKDKRAAEINFFSYTNRLHSYTISSYSLHTDYTPTLYYPTVSRIQTGYTPTLYYPTVSTHKQATLLHYIILQSPEYKQHTFLHYIILQSSHRLHSYTIVSYSLHTQTGYTLTLYYPTVLSVILEGTCMLVLSVILEGTCMLVLSVILEGTCLLVLSVILEGTCMLILSVILEGTCMLVLSVILKGTCLLALSVILKGTCLLVLSVILKFKAKYFYFTKIDHSVYTGFQWYADINCCAIYKRRTTL